MALIVQMPKLSDTMEEGGVAEWLKEVGEFVEEGEALVEIETDKATMEYASPEEGYLLEKIGQPGQSIALEAPICVLGSAKDEKYDLNQLIAELGGASEQPAASAPEPAAAATSTPAPSTAAAPSTAGARVMASPLAKKIANDQGVDLASIQGTGPGGRIIKRDLEGVSASPAATASPAAPAAAASSQGSYVDHPLSMMRKTIAKRLLAGKNEAPHFYLNVSADMTKTLEWRKQLNDPAALEKGAPKVSVNDLVMLAVSRALRKHPIVNSSWQGDFIREHKDIHVAMAVALPTGLVTPVIRDMDKMGVREIAKSAKEFGAKARAGELTNEDFAGGTFTVSNLGMTRVDSFTAIINPPQSAILAVGRTAATPSVNAAGKVEVRQKMTMTLSCDHRVIDGWVGAQFLETLVAGLEDPMTLLS